MAKLAVLDKTGKKVSDIELKDEIFGIEPNKSAMHLVVVNYLANQRQGTQSTLTRSEVSGGGKKPSAAQTGGRKNDAPRGGQSPKNSGADKPKNFKRKSGWAKPKPTAKSKKR